MSEYTDVPFSLSQHRLMKELCLAALNLPMDKAAVKNTTRLTSDTR